MRKAALVCALLVILLPLAVVAADNKTNGHCSAIQGEMVVEGGYFESTMIIDGVAEPVVEIFSSGEPVFHGKMDRGSEYALIISLIDGSSFYYYEDYSSQHTQNTFTTDPVLYSNVNAAGTIVGDSGRWANATGHMNMHGPFNFAVPSMDLWFNGNICGI